MQQRCPQRLFATRQRRGVLPAGGGHVPDERGADMVLEALAAAALHTWRVPRCKQFAFAEPPIGARV